MSEFSAEHPYSEDFEKENLIDHIKQKLENSTGAVKKQWNNLLVFYGTNRLTDEEAYFFVDKGHLPDLEEWNRDPEYIGVEPDNSEFGLDELRKPELMDVLIHQFELLDVGAEKIDYAWIIELYEGNRISDEEAYDVISEDRELAVDKW